MQYLTEKNSSKILKFNLVYALEPLISYNSKDLIVILSNLNLVPLVAKMFKRNLIKVDEQNLNAVVTLLVKGTVSPVYSYENLKTIFELVKGKVVLTDYLPLKLSRLTDTLITLEFDVQPSVKDLEGLDVQKLKKEFGLKLVITKVRLVDFIQF